MNLEVIELASALPLQLLCSVTVVGVD